MYVHLLVFHYQSECATSPPCPPNTHTHTLTHTHTHTHTHSLQDKQPRSPSPNRRTSPPTQKPHSRAPKPSFPPPPPTASMKIETREASLQRNGGQPLILPKRDSSANVFPVTHSSPSPKPKQSRPPKPKSPSPAVNGRVKSPPRSNVNGVVPNRKPPVRETKSNGMAAQASQMSRSTASPVRSPTPTSPEVSGHHIE